MTMEQRGISGKGPVVFHHFLPEESSALGFSHFGPFYGGMADAGRTAAGPCAAPII